MQNFKIWPIIVQIFIAQPQSIETERKEKKITRESEREKPEVEEVQERGVMKRERDMLCSALMRHCGMV